MPIGWQSADPQGGLATVGAYLNYADTALVAGSPGEAARALERGMKEGVVPSCRHQPAARGQAKAAVDAGQEVAAGRSCDRGQERQGREWT